MMTILTEHFRAEQARSIWSDHDFVQTILEIELAWVEAAAAVGETSHEAAREMRSACAVWGERFPELKNRFRDVGRPVEPLVSAIAEQASFDLARVLHRGLTTQDVIDTAMAILVARSVQAAIVKLSEAVDRLNRLGIEHRRTLQLGRTNGQAAAPIVFGVKIVGWTQELERGKRRLLCLAEETRIAQLFGPVGLSDAFGPATGEIRRRTAQRLNLQLPDAGWHTQRDRLGGMSLAVAVLLQSCGRIGAEVMRLASSDIGEVDEGEGQEKGKSSSMPHKRNPRLSEALGTIATLARGRASDVLATAAPAHERSGDLWIAECCAIAELFSLLLSGAELLERLSSTLNPHPDRMRANLECAGRSVFSDRIVTTLSATRGYTSAKSLTRELIVCPDTKAAVVRLGLSADEAIRIKEAFDLNSVADLGEISVLKALNGLRTG